MFVTQFTHQTFESCQGAFVELLIHILANECGAAIGSQVGGESTAMIGEIFAGQRDRFGQCGKRTVRHRIGLKWNDLLWTPADRLREADVTGLDPCRFAAAGRRADGAVPTCEVGEMFTEFTLCPAIGFERILHREALPF